jgi:hypothetical protein
MTPSVRKRTDGFGFEAGPDTLSYRYGVSLPNRYDVSFDHIISGDEQAYGCLEFTFDDGTFRSYRIGRAGKFYEMAFGKPGDPIPTVEAADIECP